MAALTLHLPGSSLTIFFSVERNPASLLRCLLLSARCSSSSASGTSSTPATSTPPTTFTPTNGVLGGLGPSGSLTSDVNHGGFLLRPGIGWLLLTLICSGIGFDATVVAMLVQKWICDSADVDAEAYLLVRV